MVNQGKLLENTTSHDLDYFQKLILGNRDLCLKIMTISFCYNIVHENVVCDEDPK